MAHALLSPSSSDRWIACPGSVQANAEITEPDTGNFASMEGTSAHSLLQVCMDFNDKPENYMGAVLDKNHPPVDQSMIDGVQVALDYIAEHIDFYGAGNLRITSEKWVRIGPMIGLDEELCNGTSDVIIEHADKSMCVVIDYKHGKGVAVDAKGNSQLRLYSAGTHYEIGEKFKQYRTVIIQPRIARRSPVQEDTFTHCTLVAWLKKEVAPSAKAALLPNAPRNAGEHCRFCRAASNCNTYRRRARAVAADEFGEIEDPEHIPNERLEEILGEAVILENWIKAVRGRALHYLTTGGQMSEYVLGWSKRLRQWDDTEAVIEWCERHKMLRDEYEPRKLITPKQMIDLAKRRKIIAKKKRGEDEAPNPFDQFITYSIPKAAIVHRDDASDMGAMDDDDE